MTAGACHQNHCLGYYNAGWVHIQKVMNIDVIRGIAVASSELALIVFDRNNDLHSNNCPKWNKLSARDIIVLSSRHDHSRLHNQDPSSWSSIQLYSYLHPHGCGSDELCLRCCWIFVGPPSGESLAMASANITRQRLSTPAGYLLELGDKYDDWESKSRYVLLSLDTIHFG